MTRHWHLALALLPTALLAQTYEGVDWNAPSTTLSSGNVWFAAANSITAANGFVVSTSRLF